MANGITPLLPNENRSSNYCPVPKGPNSSTTGDAPLIVRAFGEILLTEKKDKIAGLREQVGAMAPSPAKEILQRHLDAIEHAVPDKPSTTALVLRDLSGPVLSDQEVWVGDLGDEREVEGPFFHGYAKWNDSYDDNWPWSPQPGWFALEIHADEGSSFGEAWYHIETLAAGLDYFSEERISELYKELINAAASVNDDNLKATFQDQMNKLLELYNRVQTNQNIVRTTVHLKGSGNIFDQKGASLNFTSRVHVVRFVQSGELEQMYFASTKDIPTVSITIRNDASVPVRYKGKGLAHDWSDVQELEPGASQEWQTQPPFVIHIESTGEEYVVDPGSTDYFVMEDGTLKFYRQP